MNAIAAVFYRDYKQRITNVGFVFWDLFVPVAYLLLFGTGFQRAVANQLVVDGLPVSYTAFFLPGVLAMTTFGIAMNTSWSFFLDKESGIFYELLTYPITRRQLLVGKICFNVVLSSLGAFLTLMLGIFVLGVRVRWDLLPIAAAAIVLSTAGWFFFFSIFSIRLHRMDSFNTFTSAAYIVLMFISTMFYPIADMPRWFQILARLNPMTWQVDLLRFSVIGIGSPATVAVQSAALVAFALLCLKFAVRSIDRAA